MSFEVVYQTFMTGFFRDTPKTTAEDIGLKPMTGTNGHGFFHVIDIQHTVGGCVFFCCN